MYKSLPIIAVVTRDTRMQNLKERWVTSSAFSFRMKQAGGHEKARLMKRKRSDDLQEDDFNLMALEVADALSDDDELKEEDSIYNEALKELMFQIDFGYPVKKVNRDYIANFDFSRCAVVVVFGQDGLVANVAKYVGDVPIVGINPDPQRNDGILLPFEIRHARSVVRNTLDGKRAAKHVTLAEVTTNDGQHMLAFNDFFVGCRSHTSARYTIEYNFQTESQSSSGMIISTGAGSTGWMSSMFNMAERLSGMVNVEPATGRLIGNVDEATGRMHGGHSNRPTLKWEDNKLLWAVREPFISRHSSAEMIGGILGHEDELVVGSQMDGNGVIFSDGIESDFIEFNSGSIAAFKVANQKAMLIS